jgi:hypothetical protein
MPKRIFISYRRSDTQMAAGRLRDALVNRFGPASVFRDKEAIRPGYDWVEEIQAALQGTLWSSRWSVLNGHTRRTAKAIVGWTTRRTPTAWNSKQRWKRKSPSFQF